MDLAGSTADELRRETSHRPGLGKVGRWQSGQCGGGLPHCLDCEVTLNFRSLQQGASAETASAPTTLAGPLSISVPSPGEVALKRGLPARIRPDPLISVPSNIWFPQPGSEW